MTYGTISVLLWNTLLAGSAVALHHNWDRFQSVWQTYNLVIWIVLGIVVLFIMWRVNRPKKKESPLQ
jgi:membrane protein DedA with SNARE-associated domain